MKILQFIFWLCAPMTLMGQNVFQYEVHDLIPVEENAVTIPAPWNGGLNAAQYNSLDIDFDGNYDLVLYDRMAQKVITYLRVGSEYKYAPEYENRFPSDLYNWLIIRDFNCDGLKDIFTGHIFGIKVYQNVSTATDISWKHFPFYDGNAVSEVILTDGLSGRVNLQIQFDDLPSISDSDGDGDLDIFVMNFGGSGTIQLHKNLSHENYSTCDSLAFKLTDGWWGGIRECECDEFAYDNEECDFGGRVDHAGGKSLTLMDADGDGFQDLLISEGECDVLNMLDNNGSVESPDIQSAQHYPLGLAEEFNLYPTGYYEDLDSDGVRDLIITPTIISKTSYDINLWQSNWFYKNTGTNAIPQFTLQTKSFIQNTMIDVGDNAVPAFADIEGDGDFDMFVSNNELPSKIRVYKNVGNPFEPSFELFDEDYLNLSTKVFTLMKIQFVDIDSDGKTDLVFSGTNSELNFTDVFYLLNRASGSLDFTGQEVGRLQLSMARGENMSFIYVDNDGKVDLLKGKSNGAAEYWRNTGQMQFSLQDPEFLGIGPDVFSTRTSFASDDLNGDGKLDLILGDESGQLRIISDFRNASDLSGVLSDVVFHTIDQKYYAPNLGGRIWPTTVNLHGGLPVIVAGTTMGGIRLLRNKHEDSSAITLSVYPNPVSPDFQELKVTSNKSMTLQIFSSRGEQLRPAVFIPEKQVTQLSLHDFAAGVYILRFSQHNKTFIRRLVVF
jgi:hypothetical protein